jgi:hypothetical protein
MEQGLTCRRPTQQEFAFAGRNENRICKQGARLTEVNPHLWIRGSFSSRPVAKWPERYGIRGLKECIVTSIQCWPTRSAPG